MDLEDDLGPLCWVITIPFVVLCAVSFILRVYSRVFLAKSFGWDDWCLFIAFASWIGQQFITWRLLLLGAGKHVEALSATDVANINLYLFAEQFYCLVPLLLIKLSFLFFFRRLSTSNKLEWAIRIAAGVVFVQIIGTAILYGLQCIPLGAVLHPQDHPNAKCLSPGLVYYLPGAVNVAVDALIFLLPIQPVWRLCATADLRQRLALALMFVLGGAAIVAAGLRFVMLYEHATDNDPTWILGLVIIVATIEFCVAIFTANMPAMQAVWRHHVSGRSSSDQNSHELRDVSESARSQRRWSKRSEGTSALKSKSSGRRKSAAQGADADRDSEEGLVLDDGTALGDLKNAIKVTSQVRISVSGATQSRDGMPFYPPKYFKFSRPGAQSPTPNFMKD